MSKSVGLVCDQLPAIKVAQGEGLILYRAERATTFNSDESAGDIFHVCETLSVWEAHNTWYCLQCRIRKASRLAGRAVLKITVSVKHWTKARLSLVIMLAPARQP